MDVYFVSFIIISLWVLIYQILIYVIDSPLSVIAHYVSDSPLSVIAHYVSDSPLCQW